MTKELAFTSSEGTVSLGPQVGRGGEGDVYKILGAPSEAAKIYHPNLASSRKSKVQRIVELNLASMVPVASFPKSILRNSRGEFSGFSMALYDEMVPIFEVFGPGSRKLKLPNFDYRHLIRVAINLCNAVARVHQSGCVIGDINSNGILVRSDATVVLIDADSFQIDSAQSALRCHVGVPEYTPPELQGRSLSDIPRTTNHDAFGLAAMVFQLLFLGRHPFLGTPKVGEKSLENAIKENLYVYSRHNTFMHWPPAMNMISGMPGYLSDAFEAAFSSDRRISRPSPTDWRNILAKFEQSIERCKHSKTHFAFNAASNCQWCQLEKEHGLDPFPLSLQDLTREFSAEGSLRSARELDQLWIDIANIPDSALLNLKPDFVAGDIKPSKDAITAAKSEGAFNLSAIAGMIGIIVMLFAFPELWIVWIVGFFIAFANAKAEKIDTNSFLVQHNLARDTYVERLNSWRKLIGIGRLVELKSELIGLESALQNITVKQSEEIRQFEGRAKDLQLLEHLEKFSIRRAKIPKLSSANLTALESFGIESAADIRFLQIQKVSGIGPVKSRILMDWRRRKQASFTFNPRPSPEAIRAKAKLVNDHARERAKLAAEFISKGRALLHLNNQIRQRPKEPNSPLEYAHAELRQARANLTHLGIDKPAVSLPPWPGPSMANHSNIASDFKRASQSRRGQTAPVTAIPNCPNCNASMVLRTARRGVGAGQQFWGCRTFPKCRGTRNY